MTSWKERLAALRQARVLDTDEAIVCGAENDLREAAKKLGITDDPVRVEAEVIRNGHIGSDPMGR